MTGEDLKRANQPQPSFIMRTSLAPLLALFVTACGGGDSDSTGKDVSFATLAKSNYSAVTAREGALARSEVELKALWARYSATASPPPQPPVVDFNTTQVIGFFLGARPNGCYSVSITRVNQTSDRLVVTYKEEVPAADAVCTQAVVSPAHLVTVPMSRVPVEFVSE